MDGEIDIDYNKISNTELIPEEEAPNSNQNTYVFSRKVLYVLKIKIEFDKGIPGSFSFPNNEVNTFDYEVITTVKILR